MRTRTSNTAELINYNFQLVNRVEEQQSDKQIMRSRKLAISVKSGVVFVNPVDITKVESYGNNSIISLVDGSTYVATKSLKDFEEILSGEVFLRVHKCYLINLHFVKEFNKEMNYIEMEDGSRADISRRRKDDFFKSFLYV